jgi:hypothetical protein
VNIEIITFWRVRLDEREAAARRGYGHVWEVEATNRYHVRVRATEDAGGTGALVAMVVGGDAEHIALHDPDRVLREIGNDRRLIRRFEDVLEGFNGSGDDRRSVRPTGEIDGLLYAIKCRVANHADHPDYKPRWAPQG